MYKTLRASPFARHQTRENEGVVEAYEKIALERLSEPMSRLEMSAQSKPERKFTFSGHESFQCRHWWLKKGYDLLKSGEAFSGSDAVVKLGVGKNMVNSIRFWMKAFNLLDTSDELTNLAHRVFADDGYDPYLEDEGTLWLLHYQLVKRGFASTYAVIFNELRRERFEFTKENFVRYLKLKSETERSLQFNEKTLQEDFSVFSKMYVRSASQLLDKEDSFAGLLTDLEIVRTISNGKTEKFTIENSERPEIPDEVILFCILDDQEFDASINFNQIENGLGTIFALSRPGLHLKVENLALKFPFIVFNDQAGIKEIQFKKKPKPYSILDEYYAS